MNDLHLELLASPGWKRYLEEDLLPWVLGTTDLGGDVLEIGPGPGLTTDLLRWRAERLVAIEIDGDLASALASRLAGTNVQVLHEDATTTGLPGGSFDAVTCFTMLHHVPTPALQDQLLGETFRVLRPGGCFVGTDATETPVLRELHVDDVFVPVEAESFRRRLRAAGFVAVDVEPAEARLRFLARKPTSEDQRG